MTRSRYKIFDTHYPHFLTCSVLEWLPLFADPANVEIIFDSWRYLQKHNRILLLGYVIMENHLHFIARADDLPKEVGDFKSFTARRIIDRLLSIGAADQLELLHRLKLRHKTDRPYQVWQEGSHPEAILNESMMWQKLEYMHNNPVARGYVDDPLHWRYSSARNYAGQPGLIDVVTDW